jgi:hypothetical protein
MIQGQRNRTMRFLFVALVHFEGKLLFFFARYALSHQHARTEEFRVPGAYPDQNLLLFSC